MRRIRRSMEDVLFCISTSEVDLPNAIMERIRILLFDNFRIATIINLYETYDKK